MFKNVNADLFKKLMAKFGDHLFADSGLRDTQPTRHPLPPPPPTDAAARGPVPIPHLFDKFAGPSAQRRVRSSTIVVVFIDLSIIFDIGAAPGTLEPCGGRLGGYLVAGRSEHGDPWAPTGRFLSIFRRPEAASKNQRFLQSPKIAPGAPKITLWAPKAPFLIDF